MKHAYYLELACRFYVFILMNIYGLGKLAGGQFHRRTQLSPEVAKTTIEKISGFDLLWTFMGYSPVYIWIVGILQVFGAFCMVWERTKFVGILILLPVLFNIIILDILFSVPSGALINACVCMVFILVVICLNRIRVLQITNMIIAASPVASVNKKKAMLIAGLLVIIIIVFQQIILNMIFR